MLNYTYDGAGRLTREDNKGLDRTVRDAYDGARLVRTYCEMGTRLAEVPDFGYDAQSNSFVDTDYERRVCFGCVRKVRALAPLAACCPSELAFRLLDGLSTILWKHKVGEEWEEHEYIVRRNILGDVTQLYDTLGNLCVQYRYDAWGQVYPITIFDYHGIARVNPILYRGYVYDKETELYYLNSRYYDPETGRFLNADSLEYLEPESVYGINLYAYCGGDPVNNVDPSGHSWKSFWKGVGNFFVNAGRAIAGAVIAIAGYAIAIVGAVISITGIPGTGYVSDFGANLMMYGGFMAGAAFNKTMRSEMDAIGWDMYNTNEDVVIASTMISFYKGAAVIRTKSGGRSGSFGNIYLAKGEHYNTLRHERGHNEQLKRMGAFCYAINIGIPSVSSELYDHAYYSQPWEITADLYGGVDMNGPGRKWTYTQSEIDNGWTYIRRWNKW